MENKFALVTGAGRGIGAAIALSLAQAGYDLLLISRTLKQLKETEQKILEKTKVKVKCLALDLSDAKTFRQIESFVKKQKNWQVLINNAGVCYQKKIKKMKDTDFEKMLSINVTAVFKLCRLALQKMNARGTIINIASVAGIYGVSKFEGLGPYAATKAAVIGLTEMIAQEGNEDGKQIRGYAISPGAVETKMLRAIVSPEYQANLKPEDIAQRVIQLILKRPANLNGKNTAIWSK